MKHLQQMYQNKTKEKAQVCAHMLSLNLTDFRSAQAYTRMQRCESFPHRAKPDDMIDDNPYGEKFRQSYREHLMRCWHRNNNKTVIESAYSAALKSINTELGVTTSKAKNILLNRSQSEFWEFQE